MPRSRRSSLGMYPPGRHASALHLDVRPALTSQQSLSRRQGSSSLLTSMPATTAALPDISTLLTLRRAAAMLGHPPGGSGSVHKPLSDGIWDLDCTLAASTYARMVLNKWLWAQVVAVQVSFSPCRMTDGPYHVSGIAHGLIHSTQMCILWVCCCVALASYFYRQTG